MDKTKEKQKELILKFINGGFPCRFGLNPYKQGFKFVTELASIEFGDLVAVSLLNSFLEENIKLKKKKNNVNCNCAEERKKVVQEIRDWCDKNFNWVADGIGYDGQDYNEMIGSNNAINKLRELLDQIERGEL